MPILQRIELSNFLNSGRTKPWRPDWPHQILEINGENAALNIPNGKGKSTMVTAILAMLTSHGKSLKDIRTRFFAPTQTGHFTHIRIQVLIPMPGASGDLVAQSGGELGGQTMVFGMYGYSGENEKLEVYAYQGTFDDCPVAQVHELHHTLIADDAFLGQLRTCTNLFPGNAKERTRRAWLAFVEDFFDMSSLKQQLIYQLMRGAEGGHGYFEVKPPAGMNYSAAVFYERLAPELLTDVMGDLGEEGEHGIEDTIHEKVSKVISAKHETARKAEELRRAGNTLRELAGALELGSKLKDAKQAYDQHLGAFSVEMAVLKDVVVDAPIPGIPRTPPETIPKIARSMVMKDGQWFLSDRVMAEFTGEQTSAVNQRAHDRNGLELVHASRSQLIDFACDIKIRDARGKPNQHYSRESALALLKFTSNFTRDWTREKAIEMVTQAFDWVEAHADTNPARALKKRLEAELATKSEEREQLSTRYKDHQAEKEKLQDEQTHVGEQQSEYRRMADSRLFTEEELASPTQTGRLVGQELEKAAKSLDDHKDKVRRLKPVYEGWQAFLSEYGESISPAEKAMQLENASEEAIRLLQETQSALKKARDLRKPLDTTKEAANKRFNELDAKLKRFIEALPARDRFIKLFGEASPVGLAKQVTSDRDQTRNRLSSIEGDRNKFRPFIEALAMFQAANGDVDPDAWLLDRLNRWETLGREVERLKGDLDEAGVRRSALDQAVIVAGKVTREAVAIAGGKSVPVHEAVVKMQLPTDRMESVLTLFSALLHAPVYQTISEAVEAAGRLAKAGVEAPVFVLAELEEFCRTGVISRDAMAAHTWLVGVRTRQVDCLLDPTLVEREKALIDNQVQELTQVLSTKQTERTTCSPESEETTLARRASEQPNPARVPGVPEETTMSYKVNGRAEMTDTSLVRAHGESPRLGVSLSLSMVRESSVTLVSGASRIPFERSSRLRRFPWRCRSSMIVEKMMAMRKREDEVFPNAAAVDVGASSHWVAVPPHSTDAPVREFGAMTDDLNAMADWMLACGVDVVALESTGVYWIPVYEVLESHGLKVWLVDARQVKYVPGRKSDVQDCQWLQKLMSHGLLRAAFRPAADVCAIRAVARQREVLLTEQASWVQRMQKALVQMNIQLTEVITDVMGQTGQAILRDIVAGERDAKALARHRHRRIQASEEDIVRALTGHWREEHLFVLKQALGMYDDIARHLRECDEKLREHLAERSASRVDLGKTPRAGSKAREAFDLRQQLANWAGVDLTRINGLGLDSVMKILSEIGIDLSRFANVKHFCSWLGLCPATKISGGKVLSARTKRSANRVRQALKMAAMSLSHSDSALGAFYRRLCSRMDKPRANTATAHKLARMVYFMLTRGEAFVDQGQQRYEAQQRERSIAALKRRAAALGFQINPLEAAA